MYYWTLGTITCHKQLVCHAQGLEQSTMVPKQEGGPCTPDLVHGPLLAWTWTRPMRFGHGLDPVQVVLT
jgi:hypothetical protein